MADNESTPGGKYFGSNEQHLDVHGHQHIALLDPLSSGTRVSSSTAELS
jgi:hypothetical protein